MSETFNYQSQTSKQADIRTSNILAARDVLDTVRTSLGPRGLDKMVTNAKGELVVTNDGATIMKQLSARHPVARMLVDLSAAQDIEAGDGTTSVVVLATSLLSNTTDLFKAGIHSSKIAASFQKCQVEAQRVIDSMVIPVDLSDRSTLIKLAATSLSSKVVSPHSEILAPIAVDAVLSVRDPLFPKNVDLRNIKVIMKEGATVDHTKLFDGLVFNKTPKRLPGAVNIINNPKIALCQFCLSPPKSNMDSSLIASDHSALDRILKEEKTYTLKLVKQIRDAGANVLIVQKNIMRESVSDLAHHFLNKLGIMVIYDVELGEMDFISRTLGVSPIAGIEDLNAESLAHAELAEVKDGMTFISGCNPREDDAPTRTIIVRGTNQMVIEEAERSIHDALCVIRSLVKRPELVVGGAAVETEISRVLHRIGNESEGADHYCFKAYANAFEVVPYTLSENAGLSGIKIVSDLRKNHAEGNVNYGISVRTNSVIDMKHENVFQPALVSSCAVALATEFCVQVLKIDDMVLGM